MDIRTIDSIANTYARFYLNNPNLDLNGLVNEDFCKVIDVCLFQIIVAIPFKSEGLIGSECW